MLNKMEPQDRERGAIDALNKQLADTNYKLEIARKWLEDIASQDTFGEGGMLVQMARQASKEINALPKPQPDGIDNAINDSIDGLHGGK